MPLIERAALRQQLEQLAQACPGEHPYTLALKLQVLTGMVITGQQAKQILQRLEKYRP